MSYPNPGQSGGLAGGGPGVIGGVGVGMPLTLQIEQQVQQYHPLPPLYHPSHIPPGFMAVQQCGPWPVLSQPLPLPGALVQQQGGYQQQRGYQQQGGYPQPGHYQGWVGQPSDQPPYQPVAQHHNVYQYAYQQRGGFSSKAGIISRVDIIRSGASTSVGSASPAASLICPGPALTQLD